MHQVHLSDQLYQEAQRRATESGFASVDEYVADLLSLDLSPTEDLDLLFTPQRLALIERASSQIAAGECFSAEEADEELARRRAEWLRNNQSGS
jgi:hypothetical protein